MDKLSARLAVCIGLLAAGTVAMGLVAGCGLLYLRGQQRENEARVERLEADLNERVPDGSTWEQAEEWFASRGIEALPNTDREGRRVSLHAHVPDNTFVDAAEIRIELQFGPDGRLCKRVFYRFVYEL